MRSSKHELLGGRWDHGLWRKLGLPEARMVADGEDGEDGEGNCYATPTGWSIVDPAAEVSLTSTVVEVLR